jgi:hypothetical protein
MKHVLAVHQLLENSLSPYISFGLHIFKNNLFFSF